MRKVLSLLIVAAIICVACSTPPEVRNAQYRADTSQYALATLSLHARALELTPPINWETPAIVASTPWQDDVHALLVEFRALNKQVGKIVVPSDYEQAHVKFGNAVASYSRALDQLELFAKTPGKGVEAQEAQDAMRLFLKSATGSMNQWADLMLEATP